MDFSNNTLDYVLIIAIFSLLIGFILGFRLKETIISSFQNNYKHIQQRKIRQKKYRRLREIRIERDYQMGAKQLEGRPHTFRRVQPPPPPPSTDRKCKLVYKSTNQFIRDYGIKI